MKIRPVQLTFKEFLEETVAVIEESSLQFFVELVLVINLCQDFFHVFGP